MFSRFNEQLNKNFSEIAATGNIFYVDVDRDLVFSIYLSSFPEYTRQEFNCNCCKSFLRQYAGIVTIVNNKIVSIWDNLQVPERYVTAVNNLSNYIHSLPISSIFLTESRKCGVSKNWDAKRDVFWEHFHLTAPKNNVKKIDSIQTLKADSRAKYRDYATVVANHNRRFCGCGP